MNNFFISILTVLIIVFGPLLIIWSINTLFNLGIDYTISTWFAALVLFSITNILKK